MCFICHKIWHFINLICCSITPKTCVDLYTRHIINKLFLGQKFNGQPIHKVDFRWVYTVCTWSKLQICLTLSQPPVSHAALSYKFVQIAGYEVHKTRMCHLLLGLVNGMVVFYTISFGLMTYSCVWCCGYYTVLGVFLFLSKCPV